MTRSTKIRICHRRASMLFYPAALPLSRHTLTYVTGAIRQLCAAYPDRPRVRANIVPYSGRADWSLDTP
jgi:hypothetical protein